MADPFGITGIIGVVVQIIHLSVQFGLNWNDAPKDVQTLIEELQKLIAVLSETNTNVISNPEFVAAVQGKHSTVLSQFQGTEISTHQEELQSVLTDLIERSQGHRIGWRRIKEAFLSRKTRETVENLHRMCESVNKLVAIDNLAITAATHQEVEKSRKEQQEVHNIVTYIRNRHDNRETFEEQDRILSWLTPINYLEQQNDFIRRRQPGTGNWLLATTKFQEWVQEKQQTIFCPGIPGAGKTIFTAIVIDDLINKFHSDLTIGIAYIYCNFRRKDEQKLDNLLACLIKQFSEVLPALPKAVRELYEQHSTKRTRPSTDELLRVLQSVTASHSKIFIVVDALDECQISDGCRRRLIEECFNLQSLYGANLFMTSRFLPEITENFDRASTFEIRASPKDVRKYLAGQIFRLPRFVNRDIFLQEEIISGIIAAVDGM